MKRVPNYLIPLAFTALATVQSTSYAAVDMFLKIDNIQGESADSKHRDEIDVLAWSWDLSQSSDPTAPIVRPLSLTKWIDRSSPVLYDYLWTNKIATEASSIDITNLTVTGVTVATVSTGGSGGEDRLTENISLNFTSACVRYTPQDATGTAGTPIESCWTFEGGAK